MPTDRERRATERTLNQVTKILETEAEENQAVKDWYDKKEG